MLSLQELSHVWRVIHEDTLKENIIIFQKLIKYLKGNGVKINIVVPPYHPDYIQLHYNSINIMKEKFYKILKPYLDRGDIDMIDFFEKKAVAEDVYWADWTHLNFHGAKVLTQILNANMIGEKRNNER